MTKQQHIRDGLKLVGFVHELEILDSQGTVIERERVCNRIPQDGLAFLIQTPFGDTPPIANFYCGLFTNNFVPTNGTTAADIPVNMGEFVQYTETSRPIWDRTFVPYGQYTNNDSPAVFTPTTDASVYGSFVVSSPTKGGSDGLLISVARFNTTKAITAGNEARLRTSLTYLPTDII